MLIKNPGAHIVFLILCVLGFIIYAAAIPHPFVHDDLIYIRYNPSRITAPCLRFCTVWSFWCSE